MCNKEWKLNMNYMKFHSFFIDDSLNNQKPKEKEIKDIKNLFFKKIQENDFNLIDENWTKINLQRVLEQRHQNLKKDIEQKLQYLEYYQENRFYYYLRINNHMRMIVIKNEMNREIYPIILDLNHLIIGGGNLVYNKFEYEWDLRGKNLSVSDQRYNQEKIKKKIINSYQSYLTNSI